MVLSITKEIVRVKIYYISPMRIEMRWTIFILGVLLRMNFLQSETFEDFDTFIEDDAMINLEGEIDEMLEESQDSSLAETSKKEWKKEKLKEKQQSFPKLENKSSLIKFKNSIKEIEVKEQPQKPLSISIETINQEQIIPISTSSKEMQISLEKSLHTIQINLRQVFSGSPIIYSILFLLSISSVCIWLYSMFTVRSVEFLPNALIKDLRAKLVSNQFDEALDICVKQKHFFCKMLASGILARKYGLNIMIDTMKAEGKRSTIPFWQRIGLLNEIAIIAPMLGLLGTVLGMFYAFYDLNRSIQSIGLLFDGLGVSVGTTVGGLIVAILAMILHSLAKYRLVRTLASIENEAQNFAALIDTRPPNYLGN